MKQIKIMIVDDHQVVVEGLKTILKDIPEFKIVATASSGNEALGLAKKNSPDVVLMDISMPELNGIETTSRMHSENPGVKVIALTMHNDKGMINKMLMAGASGYVLKNTSQKELIEAIKKVSGGGKYFSSDITLTLIEKNSSHVIPVKDSMGKTELSDREIEVIKLIAQGYSSREIGEKLFISPRTADKHRTNVIQKLQVKNIADLVHYCMKNNLLE